MSKCVSKLANALNAVNTDTHTHTQEHAQTPSLTHIHMHNLRLSHTHTHTHKRENTHITTYTDVHATHNHRQTHRQTCIHEFKHTNSDTRAWARMDTLTQTHTSTHTQRQMHTATAHSLIYADLHVFHVDINCPFLIKISKFYKRGIAYLHMDTFHKR